MQISTNLGDYISFCNPNIFKKWRSEDGKAEGVVIGYTTGKYNIWSVLYIINREKKTLFPVKSHREHCAPITGILYDQIVEKIKEPMVPTYTQEKQEMME